MAEVSCRHFNGYKPCSKNPTCDSQCAHRSLPSMHILIVHLGAIGAVVRATSLLAPIRRKHPNAHITWVTDTPSDQLLRNHPRIDRVLTSKHEDILALKALEFDIAYVVDKSLKATGIVKSTTVDQIYGFTVNPRNGAILPATEAADELWSLGLDNHKKFFVNKKPETQLMVEALELGPWLRDPYDLPLAAGEQNLTQTRRQEWLSKSGPKPILGINTGCSPAIPYKKLTVNFHREIIHAIQKTLPVQIVLLGGPEDTLRNQQIAYGLNVIQSPTEDGLRDGLVSVAACDLVLTGDSLGMHMAIAQSKYTVAWFGPTCAYEIDLYDRGEAVLTQSPCAPCWKRLCEQKTMCYDQVSLNDLLAALTRGYQKCEPMSLSKQPSLATSSLASL